MTAVAAPARTLSPFSVWLDRSPAALSLFGGLMAFGAYFAMYAFRRPFAAADYNHVAGAAPILALGINYKIALVIAQLCGYALSKVIGIKFVSELPARWRALAILALIGLAELALVGFAYVPAPYNIALMFANGLPLGMIWGLVFGFVEGRRTTELLSSILCASFIVSSGAVKAVGKWLLLQSYASDFTMPMLTGLIFTPLLLVCVLGLTALPPPNAVADIAARVQRAPMDAKARAQLFAVYAPGLVALITLYVLLTALRDFRDNFAAEIWTDVGLGGKADIFATSELPIGVVVLLALAFLAMFKSNRTAIIANVSLINGPGLVLAERPASPAFSLHALGPVSWMILLGGGLYLAYTPFNGAIFERMVAATGKVGTAGFLIYIADSAGYTGSVALLLVKNFSGLHLAWAQFLITASVTSGVLGLGLLAYAARFFIVKLAR